MTQKHCFKVDKLIRDKLPKLMYQSGIQVLERVMEKDEYLKRLKDKLLEEAREVITATSAKEICEELADLLEVILAMARAYEIDFTNILSSADQKRSEKGVFDGRIYSAFIEIEEGHPSLGYYRARLDQYPEVK